MTDNRSSEQHAIVRDAVISDCGQYRYRLFRQWAETERMPVLWLMLNPSTADASIDDPTIRRCMAFSKAWGYGAMWVGNVFAYRSTDPAVLSRVENAIGPSNHMHLSAMGCQSAIAVAAWGAHLMAAGSESREALRAVGCPGGVWCLGRTKAGSPRHPLYVSGSTERQEFRL